MADQNRPTFPTFGELFSPDAAVANDALERASYRLTEPIQVLLQSAKEVAREGARRSVEDQIDQHKFINDLIDRALNYLFGPREPDPNTYQYMQLDQIPVMLASLEFSTYGYSGRPRSTMNQDEIEAASRAELHLGAGYGGFSVVGPPDSTSGRTIDSAGNIFNGDQGNPNGNHAQFSSGKDALDAIANFFGRGRDDNAPTTAPPAPPPSVPDSPPDNPAY